LFCGKLDDLAFLPVDEVPEGMTHLKDNSSQAVMHLISFFPG